MKSIDRRTYWQDRTDYLVDTHAPHAQYLAQCRQLREAELYRVQQVTRTRPKELRNVRSPETLRAITQPGARHVELPTPEQFLAVASEYVIGPNQLSTLLVDRLRVTRLKNLPQEHWQQLFTLHAVLGGLPAVPTHEQLWKPGPWDTDEAQRLSTAIVQVPPEVRRLRAALLWAIAFDSPSDLRQDPQRLLFELSTLAAWLWNQPITLNWNVAQTCMAAAAVDTQQRARMLQFFSAAPPADPRWGPLWLTAQLGLSIFEVFSLCPGTRPEQYFIADEDGGVLRPVYVPKSLQAVLLDVRDRLNLGASAGPFVFELGACRALVRVARSTSLSRRQLSLLYTNYLANKYMWRYPYTGLVAMQYWSSCALASGHTPQQICAHFDLPDYFSRLLCALADVEQLS